MAGLLRSSRLRRIILGAVGYFLLAYLFLLVIFIIYRHPYRIDFTRERQNTLSRETLNRLALLKENVRVLIPVWSPSASRRPLP